MAKARIMVVEDEGITALNIQSNLEGLGYSVPVVVASGEEAIEAVEESRPDLVLMDISLAGEMDGVEAAEQIRERFDVPVIYLTAYADDDTLQRAKITEPSGYILKPFDERELYTAIEIALYKHKTAIQHTQPEQHDEETQQREEETGVSVPDETATEDVASPPREPTILVIEDDPTTASLVELTLGSEGYRVITAPNGLQGLKMAQATPPDLILLDLMLPGMDGFEILNRLRAEPRTAELLVVILSAKGKLSDRKVADRLGADAYLPKSYEKDELLDLLHSLLEGRPEEKVHP